MNKSDKTKIARLINSVIVGKIMVDRNIANGENNEETQRLMLWHDWDAKELNGMLGEAAVGLYFPND